MGLDKATSALMRLNAMEWAANATENHFLFTR